MFELKTKPRKNKHPLISIVSQGILNIVFEESFSFLAQGPLMITGGGMGMYPTGGYGGAGVYSAYGGGNAPGYSGY